MKNLYLACGERINFAKGLDKFLGGDKSLFTHSSRCIPMDNLRYDYVFLFDNPLPFFDYSKDDLDKFGEKINNKNLPLFWLFSKQEFKKRDYSKPSASPSRNTIDKYLTQIIQTDRMSLPRVTKEIVGELGIDGIDISGYMGKKINDDKRKDYRVKKQHKREDREMINEMRSY